MPRQALASRRWPQRPRPRAGHPRHMHKVQHPSRPRARHCIRRPEPLLHIPLRRHLHRARRTALRPGLSRKRLRMYQLEAVLLLQARPEDQRTKASALPIPSSPPIKAREALRPPVVRREDQGLRANAGAIPSNRRTREPVALRHTARRRRTPKPRTSRARRSTAAPAAPRATRRSKEDTRRNRVATRLSKATLLSKAIRRSRVRPPRVTTSSRAVPRQPRPPQPAASAAC
jgi:hypothetical protein